MVALALALLAATPPDAPAPVKLASVGFIQLNLTEQLANVYAETFANKLQACGGLTVMTPKDIAAVLGIERQKQLLGCSDESSSCSAEIAGALGVDAVIRGDVARVGTAYQINVRVLHANSGASIAVFTRQANSEQELLNGIAQGAREAAPKVRAAFGRPAGGCAEPGSTGVPRVLAAVPGALGVATLAVGIGFWVSAGMKYVALSNMTMPDVHAALQLRDDGTFQQTLGIALSVTGAVLVAAAAVWYRLAGDGSAPSALLVPAPNGIAFAGAWP